MFRVFPDSVEIPVAYKDITVPGIGQGGIGDMFSRRRKWKIFLGLEHSLLCHKRKTGNGILRRVTSPNTAWRVLVSSYCAATRVVKFRPDVLNLVPIRLTAVPKWAMMPVIYKITKRRFRMKAPVSCFSKSWWKSTMSCGR